MGNRVRRAEAGVPQEGVFRNKIELAEEMLERAFEAAVPARSVVADSFYGRSHTFWAWLEERGRPYAVMVPKTNAVPLDGRKKKIEQHVERLPEEAFSGVRPRRDTGGRRPWEWACLNLAPDPEKGMKRWLLVRRSTDDPRDRGFYQAYGPEGTTLEELVGVCQDRWAVEQCFAEAKGEVGLDHYEVRRWDAWHRHVTLCLFAHAFLVAVRLASAREGVSGRGGKRGSRRGSNPPTVPEVRRLVLAVAEPTARRRFLVGWSAWRRAHQAAAARCRAAKRALGQAIRGERPLETAAIPSEGARG